jgi:hypothetical protein
VHFPLPPTTKQADQGWTPYRPKENPMNRMSIASRSIASLVASAIVAVSCSHSTDTPPPAGSFAGGGAGGSSAGDGSWGTGSASPTTTAGASTSTSTSATSGTSSGAGTQCTYPPGPYGIVVGSIVDPSLHWQGFEPGAQQASDISITEFFDCDGSKGINALLVDESATWCGTCQQEAKDIQQQMSGWTTSDGIRVLTLMIQDGSQNPATVATAQQWRDNFGLTDIAVAADPNTPLIDPNEMTVGLPVQLVVDPRTMKIVHYEEGYSGSYSALVNLAQKNKP